LKIGIWALISGFFDVSVIVLLEFGFDLTNVVKYRPWWIVVVDFLKTTAFFGRLNDRF
jgi:hypothetical protein